MVRFQNRIKLHNFLKKTIMGTPYKMKGSPMQRNFSISPVKDVNKSKKIAEENKLDTSVKEINYRTKLKTIKPTKDKARKGTNPKNVGSNRTSPPVTPKSHTVTPPKKNRTDTVKGNTQFKSDINKVRSGGGVELVKNKVKKAYDYFTKN